LVLLLDDNETSEDLMFSIIHAVEMFEDDIYVSHILDVLPELWARSPRWTKILHMRIWNSTATRAAYVDRLQHGTEGQRRTAKMVLRDVAQWHPEFSESIDAVLAQL